MDRIWLYIVSAFVFVLGLLGLERKRRMNAEQDLKTAKHDQTDSILVEKQKQVEEKISEEAKNAEEEKGKTLTKEDMVEFLKKL